MIFRHSPEYAVAVTTTRSNAPDIATVETGE
jgi:hypothetical protein